MKNKEFKIGPVIACIITMLCVGIVYMWNVFQQPVMDHYGWEKTAVSPRSPPTVPSGRSTCPGGCVATAPDTVQLAAFVQ